MNTPRKQDTVADPAGKTPDQETMDFLAELNADFGKKKKGALEPAHKALNRSWHQANAPLAKSSGKSPEKLNPEDSLAWQPIANVTHVVIQECACCSDVTEFIGGEYVKFKSTRPFGGEILRSSAHCPNLFLVHEILNPLEDIIEWHYQKVARCSGCIRVDQAAQAVIWDQKLEEERKQIAQRELDFNVAANDEEIVVKGLDDDQV